jgi:hypothetical protein
MNVNTPTLTLILFFIGTLILDALFLRFLRTHHPALWRELGEPGVIRNNNPRITMNIARYLFSRSYRGLQDRRLVWMFDCLRILAVVPLFIFIWFLISLFR